MNGPAIVNVSMCGRPVESYVPAELRRNGRSRCVPSPILRTNDAPTSCGPALIGTVTCSFASTASLRSVKPKLLRSQDLPAPEKERLFDALKHSKALETAVAMRDELVALWARSNASKEQLLQELGAARAALSAQRGEGLALRSRLASLEAQHSGCDSSKKRLQVRQGRC